MMLLEAKLDIPVSLRGRIKPGMAGRVSVKALQEPVNLTPRR
jgi:hypothetical protein